MSKKKRKRAKGKGKGAAHERKVCWALSRFIDPDGSDTLFWRSAMSGGRSTLQRKKGIKNLAQSGDISCIDAKGQPFIEMFMLECKFYKDLDLSSALLFGKGRLAGFWRVHRKLAKKQGRAPVMIAKQNFTGTLVLVNARGYNKLKTLFGVNAVPLAISHAMSKYPVWFFKFEDVFGSEV